MKVWRDENDGSRGLPTGTNLKDWVFLLLPEPEVGAARNAFRLKWMAPRDVASLSELEMDEALWAVGDARRIERQYGVLLEFLEDQSAYLADLIARWSETPVHHSRPFLDTTRERTCRATVGCAELLMRVPTSPPVMEALFEKFTALNSTDIPALDLVPALMSGLPERQRDVLSSMRNAIASDGTRARDAVWALLFWLRGTTDNGWSAPPEDLIREIGVIVATRREAALVDALRLVEWLFADGDTDLRAVVKDLVLEGLGYLLSELDYGRDDMTTSLDVPQVRWRCAAVAAAIEQSDPGEPIVSTWLKESAQDPMPEVRYAGDQVRFRMS